MVNGYSIRKSAKVVEINIATSFFWRHKILDCISTFLGKGYINGVIEADKEIINAKNFIVQSNVAHSYIKIKDLKNREPMHV